MIRLALFLALLASTISAHAQTVTGTPADEHKIKELIAQHASSAQKDDADGMVATQHNDFDERIDDGRILVGKAEVAKFYSSIVADGPHRLAHVHSTHSIRIRFLTPDVAFVDIDSASMSGKGARTAYFLVFTKVDGKWAAAVARSGAEIE